MDRAHMNIASRTDDYRAHLQPRFTGQLDGTYMHIEYRANT